MSTTAAPLPGSATAAAEPIHRAIFAAALLALAWLPFWFGGDRLWAWGVNALIFGTLTGLLELQRIASGAPHPVPLPRIWPAAVAAMLTLAWCLVQMSTTLPPALHHPLWPMASDALGIAVPGSISIDPNATALAVLRLATAMCTFWLFLQLCQSPARARALVSALALIGLAYALYGIVAFFLFPKSLLWFDKVHYLGSLTSTFVNRNSYASYALIGLICAALKAARAFGGTAGGVRRTLAEMLAGITGEGGAWLAVSAVIFLATTLTASRGGIGASIIGLAVALLIATLKARGAQPTRALTAALIGLGALSLLAVFGDLLVDRLLSQGLRSDDRLAVYTLTLGSILDRPWLGAGYGTFEQVFPLYRDTSVGLSGTWDRAHNTYLELLQGLGIPAALVFLAGIGALVWRCFAGYLRRRHPPTAPLAAGAVSLALGLHASVDFSLQCQAVTLTWLALLGAGVAQSWSRRERTHD